ncbi:MAG: hypothetical protein KDA87_00655 [Planctomycetales bacterium]|nr:hypothetical protein [Planctomycetales bacterium]
MTGKLTEAQRSLVRARQAAQERLEQIDNERREIRASIRSLNAALKALTKPKRRRRPTAANELPPDAVNPTETSRETDDTASNSPE